MARQLHYVAAVQQDIAKEEDKVMKKTLVAIAATIIISTVPNVRADEIDKKTNITVNENLLIPGRVLPPGKYVMKLLNATANRHVVQIFNEDQDKLEATILAFNNYRLTPTGDTVLQYWETPAGSPPALRAWFFPGDNYGQEFAYPRETAELLARENNNAKIPSYEAAANTTPTADEFAQLNVQNVDPAPPQPAAREVAQAPAPPPAPAPVAAPEPVTNAPAAQENTVLAQNAAPVPVDTINSEQPSELPRTASQMPWVVSAGLLALMLALIVRSFNKA
jgi:hypothetical protein